MVRHALWLLALVGAGWLVWVQGPGWAQTARPEYELKAVCLYNFFKFVDWPKDAVPGDAKTFHLGILGPDPFGQYLKALGERQAKGKKIVIHYFKTASDYKPCHLLFVSAKPADQEDAARRLAAALAATEGKPVLIVGETEGLAGKGAVINILIEKNLPVIEVNIDAEKRRGVTIDTQLLELARIVRDAKE